MLKSDESIKMSIRIIELFIKMRELLFTHKDILLQSEKIERKLTNHDQQIQLLFQYIKQLLNPPASAREPIGFKVKRDNE